MGKGAGDDCRGAMTLDAALPAPAGVLPNPERFAAIFTAFEHPRSGLRATLKQVGPYNGREYDDLEGDFFQAEGISVLCAITDTATGEETGSFARRCWIDSSGRLAVRHSNIFFDDHSRMRSGFGTDLVAHAIPLYRQLGAHRLELGATGLGSYAWSRFPFYLLPPKGMSYAEAAQDPRRASALGGHDDDFYATCVYRLEQMVAKGQLPLEEARAVAVQFPTLEQAEAGELHGKACTPAEVAQLGRDGTRFDDVRDDRVKYRVSSWAGRQMLAHGDWNGIMYLG